MLERFEPARFSIPDLHFLREHLGTSPAVAFRQELPPGTHRNSLDEVLRTVYEYEEIKKAEDDFAWAGVDAVSDSIERFLVWHKRSQEIQRRGIRDSNGSLVTYPSMYAWDEDGRAFRLAVDADAADMVRTEILEDGSRRAFGVTLASPTGDTLPHISDIAPWVKVNGPSRSRPDDKIVDEKSESNKRIAHLRCTICDKTEEYDTKNDGKRRMAMVRMIQHLKRAKVSINRHRVLLTKVAH